MKTEEAYYLLGKIDAKLERLQSDLLDAKAKMEEIRRDLDIIDVKLRELREKFEAIKRGEKQ